MKRRLFLRPEAEVAIAAAFNSSTLRSPEHASALLIDVDEVLERILAEPRLYAIRAGRTRRVNLKSVPFALYFLIEEGHDALSNQPVEEIVVTLFLHQRQDFEAARRQTD
jgi:hypothetical protein